MEGMRSKAGGNISPTSRPISGTPLASRVSESSLPASDPSTTMAASR